MADELNNEAVAAEEPAAAEKAAKKVKKKTPVIIGVIAVVLIAAGAGFFVWHEQPSFCAAICHTPMDAYYVTYDTGEIDKYGNDLTDEIDKNAMMAYLHKSLNGTTCMDCHVPTLSEQVTEGIHWVTGNYVVLGTTEKGHTILESRTTEQLTAARGATADEFCLNSGCHVNADGSVMTRDDLLALTADLSPVRNPHLAQHKELACTECHHGHSQSVNYCSQCHDDAPIPEGWLTVAQANQIQAL